MADPALGDIRRILVIRALPGVGDLLCAVPALRALRQAWPRAHLALLGLLPAGPILERAGGHVDRVIRFRGWPGLPESPDGDVRAIHRAVAELQAEGFDLVFQMHGSGALVNPLALLIGAPTTIGWRPAGTPPLAAGTFFEHPDRLHEIHRLTALVERLGLPVPGHHLEFRIEPAEHDRARSLLARCSPSAEPYVCLHAGAASASRRWEAERFAAVGDALAALGLRTVLTGSVVEQPLAAQVAAAMSAPVTDLSGRTTLGELAAVLSAARLVVCNDTGISHLCAALGTPSVVVFVDSDPARWAPLDTTRHRPVTAGGAGGRSPSVAAVVGEAYRLLNRCDSVADPVPTDPSGPGPLAATGSGSVV